MLPTRFMWLCGGILFEGWAAAAAHSWWWWLIVAWGPLLAILLWDDG